MDDDLDPKDIEDTEDEEIDEDVDDILLPGKKKSKKPTVDDDSLDALADEEDEILPEDAFDDQDLY